MKKLIAVCMAVILLVSGSVMAIGTWTPFDIPGAAGTVITGIDGDSIVGTYYYESGESHGFLYNMTSNAWISLDAPGMDVTSPEDVESDRIIGWYRTSGTYYDHGFLYNVADSTWTQLDMLGANDTYANGINGDTIVGEYQVGASPVEHHGFLYNTSSNTWNTFDVDLDGAVGTILSGVDGGNIVGSFYSPVIGGCIYNGTNWASLDMSGTFVTPEDIDGSNIVGSSGLFQHGFLYDGTNWTTLDMPGANFTVANGIDGDSIVGYYRVLGSPYYHGFIYTNSAMPVVPAPGAILLGGIGVSLVGWMRRRRML